MKYRELDISDYDRVYRLWDKSEGVGLSTSDARESIKLFLERNPGFSFICQHMNEIIGSILGGHDGRRGYIHHLTVDPTFRRGGIGTELVNRTSNKFKDAGLKKAHLFVFSNNKAGLHFWNHIGWQDRVDLKIMSKMIEIDYS